MCLVVDIVFYTNLIIGCFFIYSNISFIRVIDFGAVGYSIIYIYSLLFGICIYLTYGSYLVITFFEVDKANTIFPGTLRGFKTLYDMFRSLLPYVDVNYRHGNKIPL